MSSSPVLQLQNVSRAFGAVIVADNISFELPKGQALGIVGPNGAGKTSLFNLITGALKPSSGLVYFDGQNVSGLNVVQRSRLGMGRSFQIPQPFGQMSVMENCLTAATQSGAMPIAEAQDFCLSVLEDTGLIERGNVDARKLTLLERKRLELARAMCTRAKLLLLDEIAGGLTEAECDSLVQTIQRISAQGTPLIWIEHVVHALLAVVERLIVINFGKVVADGEPHGTMNSTDVKEIYLGIDGHG